MQHGHSYQKIRRSTAECSDAGDSWKYDCELCKPSGIENAVRFIVIRKQERLIMAQHLWKQESRMPVEMGEFKAYQMHLVGEE